MSIFRNLISAATVAVLALGLSAPAKAATVVDVQLQLLIDVSGSVDATEFNLQRTGYVNAFNSTAVQDAILAVSDSRVGKIAVQAIYWGTQQAIAVDWTLLDSFAAIQGFATSLNSAARPFSGSTGIGSAINFGVAQFTDNGFTGGTKVIDVSGDGTSNVGANLATARSAALTTGGIDRINGIAIGNITLLNYYKDNVIGGTGAFALQSTGFDTFDAAIRTKLAAEIRGEDPTNPTPVIPLPAAGWLMFAGLGALVAVGRRRRQA